MKKIIAFAFLISMAMILLLLPANVVTAGTEAVSSDFHTAIVEHPSDDLQRLPTAPEDEKEDEGDSGDDGDDDSDGFDRLWDVSSLG